MWWRVWVLWRDGRVLHCALAYICGGVLLAATFSESRLPPLFSCSLRMRLMSRVYVATGVIDTSFSCKAQGGFMYEGLLVGTVASMLSLGTNLAATALTAYKAWFVSSFIQCRISVEYMTYSCRVHRRCIRRRVASGSHNTQVESIFALIVESGALYCTLWVRVHIYCTHIPALHPR